MEITEHDYSEAPGDKEELLARIRREWDALELVVEQLGPEQMAVPGEEGWSIKDNLAHLAAWERFLHLHYLGAMAAHEAMAIDEEAYQGIDEDGLNAILFQRNRQRSSREVLVEFRQTHEQAMAYLERLPFEDLLKPRLAGDPESGALLRSVSGNTYEHFLEHRLTIESMIQSFRQEKS
jgi:hypothetical protein